MTQVYTKYNIWFKSISVALVCLLLLESVSYADPDIFQPKRGTLAAQSIFKPILDTVGIQYASRVSAEIAFIRDMALKGIMAKPDEASRRYRSRLNINAELIKWYVKWYSGDRRHKKLLEVVSQPQERPDGSVEVRVRTTGPKDHRREFKLVFKADGSAETLEPGEIEIAPVAAGLREAAGEIMAAAERGSTSGEEAGLIPDSEPPSRVRTVIKDIDPGLLMAGDLIELESGDGSKHIFRMLETPRRIHDTSRLARAEETIKGEGRIFMLKFDVGPKEIEIVSAMDHPNIIKGSPMKDGRGEIILVTDFVGDPKAYPEGCRFTQYALSIRDKPLAEYAASIIQILIDASDALIYLKSSNNPIGKAVTLGESANLHILVDENGRGRIVDFGGAAYKDEDEGRFKNILFSHSDNLKACLNEALFHSDIRKYPVIAQMISEAMAKEGESKDEYPLERVRKELETLRDKFKTTWAGLDRSLLNMKLSDFTKPGCVLMYLGATGVSVLYIGRAEDGKKYVIKISKPSHGAVLERDANIILELAQDKDPVISELPPRLTGFGEVAKEDVPYLLEVNKLSEGDPLEAQTRSLAGQKYHITELIKGETLESRAKNLSHTIPWYFRVLTFLPAARRACLEMESKLLDDLILTAETLQAMHEKDIVHRDLGENEIFFSPNRRIKITDFGLAATPRFGLDTLPREYWSYAKRKYHSDIEYREGRMRDVGIFILMAKEYAALLPRYSQARKAIKNFPIVTSMKGVKAYLERVRAANPVSHNTEFTPHARMPRAYPGMNGTTLAGFRPPRYAGKRAVPRAYAWDSTRTTSDAGGAAIGKRRSSAPRSARDLGPGETRASTSGSVSSAGAAALAKVSLYSGLALAGGLMSFYFYKRLYPYIKAHSREGHGKGALGLAFEKAGYDLKEEWDEFLRLVFRREIKIGAGSIIDGHRLIKAIASGGYGKVYLAEGQDGGRDLALKVLLPNRPDFKKKKESLEKELEVAEQIGGHPNIVKIYRLKEFHGAACLLMEFVEGKLGKDERPDLEELMKSQKVSLSLQEKIKIFKDAAQGLSHLHANGVSHLDIKPRNILISKDGTAKLADFGFAASGMVVAEEDREGIQGTLPFMSPEQLKQSRNLDWRSDIYSLGVTMYVLFTGEYPYGEAITRLERMRSAKDAISLLRKAQKAPIKPPSEVNPEIPPFLDKIILKCLRRIQGETYARCEDILADLERLTIEKEKPGRDSSSGSADLPKDGAPPIAPAPEALVLNQTQEQLFDTFCEVRHAFMNMLIGINFIEDILEAIPEDMKREKGLIPPVFYKRESSAKEIFGAPPEDSYLNTRKWAEKNLKAVNDCEAMIGVIHGAPSICETGTSIEKKMSLVEMAGRDARELLTAFMRQSDTDEKRLIDLNEVIGQVVDLEAILLAHRHRPVESAISFSPSSSIPKIAANPMGLRQVLTNLLRNAAQAMPDGGKITVETAHNKEAGEIQVKISDTGAGIPPENRQKIFERYFTERADGTEGTGLGLFVSLRIIEEHGGSIEVDSLTQEEADKFKLEGMGYQIDLANALAGNPELQIKTKEAYQGMLGAFQEFERSIEKRSTSDKALEDMKNLLSAYISTVLPVRDTVVEELGANPNNLPLIGFLCDCFTKAFMDLGLHVILIEKFAFPVDKEAIERKIIDYKKLLVAFERLSQGKRIEPGTTFTIRLPTAQKTGSDGAAASVSESAAASGRGSTSGEAAGEKSLEELFNRLDSSLGLMDDRLAHILTVISGKSEKRKGDFGDLRRSLIGVETILYEINEVIESEGHSSQARQRLKEYEERFRKLKKALFRLKPKIEEIYEEKLEGTKETTAITGRRPVRKGVERLALALMVILALANGAYYGYYYGWKPYISKQTPPQLSSTYGLGESLPAVTVKSTEELAGKKIGEESHLQWFWLAETRLYWLKFAGVSFTDGLEALDSFMRKRGVAFPTGARFYPVNMLAEYFSRKSADLNKAELRLLHDLEDMGLIQRKAMRYHASGAGPAGIVIISANLTEKQLGEIRIRITQLYPEYLRPAPQPILLPHLPSKGRSSSSGERVFSGKDVVEDASTYKFSPGTSPNIASKPGLTSSTHLGSLCAAAAMAAFLATSSPWAIGLFPLLMLAPIIEMCGLAVVYLMRKPSFSRTISFLFKPSGRSFPRRFSKAEQISETVGGCIRMRIIPEVLEGGYRSGSRKSLSWVIRIRSSSAAMRNTCPFLSPFAGTFISYPEFSRNSITSLRRFSSAMNLYLGGLGKRDVLLILNHFRGKVQGRLDVFFGKARIAFYNLLGRLSGLKKLKDKIYHNPRPPETGLPVAGINIGSYISIIVSHFYHLLNKINNTLFRKSQAQIAIVAIVLGAADAISISLPKRGLRGKSNPGSADTPLDSAKPEGSAAKTRLIKPATKASAGERSSTSGKRAFSGKDVFENEPGDNFRVRRVAPLTIATTGSASEGTASGIPSEPEDRSSASGEKSLERKTPETDEERNSASGMSLDGMAPKTANDYLLISKVFLRKPSSISKLFRMLSPNRPETKLWGGRFKQAASILLNLKPKNLISGILTTGTYSVPLAVIISIRLLGLDGSHPIASAVSVGMVLILAPVSSTILIILTSRLPLRRASKTIILEFVSISRGIFTMLERNGIALRKPVLGIVNKYKSFIGERFFEDRIPVAAMGKHISSQRYSGRVVQFSYFNQQPLIVEFFTNIFYLLGLHSLSPQKKSNTILSYSQEEPEGIEFSSRPVSGGAASDRGSMSGERAFSGKDVFENEPGDKFRSAIVYTKNPSPEPAAASKDKIPGKERTSASGETAAGNVTLEEIRAAIDEIDRLYGGVVFDEGAKDRIVEKVLNMRLIKGKSVLVVGPGDSDYLPVLFAKLGLETSIIEIERESLNGQVELFKRLGIEGKIGVFASYGEMGDRKFDYIAAFAVLHYAITTPEKLRTYRDLISLTTLYMSDQENQRDVMGMIKRFERESISELIQPILMHLNPQGGYIFINDINDRREGVELLGILGDVLAGLGKDLGVQFVRDTGIDVDNFSMYPLPFYLNENRIGVVYRTTDQSRLRDSTSGAVGMTMAGYLFISAIKDLAESNKFFPYHLNILKDFAQESLSDILTFVKRHYRRAAIRMPKIDMAAFLPDAFKTKVMEDTDDFGGLKRGEPAHQLTSTSWRPTNSKGGVLGRSTSKQSWITSFIRSSKAGKVLAWVWHPFKEGTVPTKTPSSSLSIRTKNCFLRISSLLLSNINNILRLPRSQAEINAAAVAAVGPVSEGAASYPHAAPERGSTIGADAEAKDNIAKQVLWLATRMIYEANKEKHAVKTGGHPAGCASALHIMLALELFAMLGYDYAAHKPHAGPVFHAIRFLMGDLPIAALSGLRENPITIARNHYVESVLAQLPPEMRQEYERDSQAFMKQLPPAAQKGFAKIGLHSYPGMFDPDGVAIPTGSVGMGPAMAISLAFAHRWLERRGVVLPKAHYWAVLGDGEAAEGNLLEILSLVKRHQLNNVTLIVDCNRQSLDGNLPDETLDLLRGIFPACGWQVKELHWGRKIQNAFNREAEGRMFRQVMEGIGPGEYQNLIAQGGSAIRGALLDKEPGLSGFLKAYGDEELYELFTDLGGHDLEELTKAMQEAREGEQPVVILAHTIKGWGLRPLMGDPGNHSRLLTAKEIQELTGRLNIPADEPFPDFADGSGEKELLMRVKRRLAEERSAGQAQIKKNEGEFLTALEKTRPTFPALIKPDIPDIMKEISTQVYLGYLVAKLRRIARAPYAELTPEEAALKPIAGHLVTLSPDVATSTSIIRSPKELGEESHIRLGITEMTAVTLAAALGKSRFFTGWPLFPILVGYDVFLLQRALDQLSYGQYFQSRFILIGTPTGATLSPEGALHRSVVSGVIGRSLPNTITWEPAFGLELDYMLLESLRRMANQDDVGRNVVYIRLATMPISRKELYRRLGYNSEEEVPAAWKEDVLNGGYRLVDYSKTEDYKPDENVVNLVTIGPMVKEVLAASDELLRGRGIYANVIVVTSPTKLLGRLARENNFAQLGKLIPEDERLFTPVVSIADAAPEYLAGIGDIGLGLGVKSLGLEINAGSRRDPEALYLHFGISRVQIVEAAKAALDERDAGLGPVKNIYNQAAAERGSASGESWLSSYFVLNPLPGLKVDSGLAGMWTSGNAVFRTLFEKFKEFFYRQFRVFKDAFKRPTVKFSMVGNNQRDLLDGVKEFNVAAALSDFNVSGAQKSTNDFIPGKQGRLHYYIARLKTLWEEVERISFGFGSRYSRIASLIFLIAFFSVLPWLWQPGSEGTFAVIYPSSPFSKTIFNLIFLTSVIIYTIDKPQSQGKTAAVAAAGPVSRGAAPGESAEPKGPRESSSGAMRIGAASKSEPALGSKARRVKELFGESVITDELDLNYEFQQFVEKFRREQFMKGNRGGAKRLLEWVPNHLRVVPLLTCTSKCAHCGISGGPNKKERLSIEDMAKIFDTANILVNNPPTHISGGEVLIRKDLIELIRRFPIYSLTTNASTMTTKDRAKKFAGDLRDAFHTRMAGIRKGVINPGIEDFLKLDAYQRSWANYQRLRKRVIDTYQNKRFALDISLDDLHLSQKSISIRKIANLIEAMAEDFPEADILLFTLDRTWEGAFKALQEEFGRRGYEFSLSGDGEMKKFILKKNGAKETIKEISFLQNKLAKFGRALNLPNSYFSDLDEVNKIVFGRELFVDYAVINYNGDLTIADFFASEHGPLVFGNLLEEGWADILRRLDKDPLFRCLVGNPPGRAESRGARVVCDIADEYDKGIVDNIGKGKPGGYDALVYWLLSKPERKLYVAYRLLSELGAQGILDVDSPVKDLPNEGIKELANAQIAELRKKFKEAAANSAATSSKERGSASGAAPITAFAAGMYAGLASSSSVGFCPQLNPFHKYRRAFNVKGNAVFANTEAVGRGWKVNQEFSADQRIGQRGIGGQFFVNSPLVRRSEVSKVLFSPGSKLDSEHRGYLSPRLFCIFEKGIQPLRFASRSASLRDWTNFGLGGNFASISSINQPAGLVALEWYSALVRRSMAASSIVDRTSRNAGVSKRNNWGTPFLSATIPARESLCSLNFANIDLVQPTNFAPLSLLIAKLVFLLATTAPFLKTKLEWPNHKNNTIPSRESQVLSQLPPGMYANPFSDKEPNDAGVAPGEPAEPKGPRESSNGAAQKSPARRQVTVVDLKTGETIARIPRKKLNKYIRESDDVLIEDDRFNIRGGLYISAGYIATFSAYPNQRIEYEVHKGRVDRTTIRLLDEKGKPITEGIRYAKDLATGAIRCHLPKRVEKELLRKLDNVLIVNDKLDNHGSLAIGSKLVATFSKYPNQRIEYEVHKGRVDRTTIRLLDEKGKPLTEGIRYAKDLATGAIRCHLPDALSKRLLNRLDNVLIVNNRLDSHGSLAIGSKLVATFSKYPNHRIEYEVHKGAVTKVRIISEDGAALHEETLKVVRDKKGQSITSYKSKSIPLRAMRHFESIGSIENYVVEDGNFLKLTKGLVYIFTRWEDLAGRPLKVLFEIDERSGKNLPFEFIFPPLKKKEAELRIKAKEALSIPRILIGIIHGGEEGKGYVFDSSVLPVLSEEETKELRSAIGKAIDELPSDKKDLAKRVVGAFLKETGASEEEKTQEELIAGSLGVGIAEVIEILNLLSKAEALKPWRVEDSRDLAAPKGEASHPRESSSGIDAGHRDSMLLFNRAAKQLRGYPVDVMVDLSLIPKEDLEANMRTWAYLMLLHERGGLDVNYIFNSSDETYVREAQDVLLEEMRKLPAMVDIETVKPRINRPHADTRTLTVSIVKKEELERLEEIPENIFPVAMSDGKEAAGTILRDFSSAVAIGLAQAACAKVRREAPQEFDEAVSDAYPKMLKIYQRSLGLTDDEFTPETLKDIITSPAVRINHAIALALPPIARAAIQYLKDYHDRIQLLLEAA